MGELRKSVRLAAVSVGVLLVAVVAFYFLVLPRLIGSQALKARIQTLAQQQLGAKVDFKRLELHLLPRPNVKLTGFVLSIAPNISSVTAGLRIAPEILPLFAGKVRIASVRAESSTLNLALADVPGGGESRAPEFPIVELRKRLEAMIAALPTMKIPRLKLQVDDSRVNLRIGRQQVLEFTEIDGDLRGTGEQREMSFRCASPLWREVSIRASLNTRTFKSDAFIRLSRLRLRQLAAQLFPGAGFRVDGEPVSIEMRLRSDGPTHLRAQIEGAVTSLQLRRSGKTFDIRCPVVKGSLEVTGEAIDLTLSRLSLTHPAMEVSAGLTLNSDIPRVALQVEGRQVDVKALRQVALGLLDGSETVQDIFNVVRAGRVPRITVTSGGRAAAELGDMDRLVIRGEMQAGEIYVPSGQLDLREASGRAVISRGILVGENLSARLANSRGRDGSLRLGLMGDERPFHLEIGVQADLSDLPPVLGRLVDGRDFKRQLALIEALKGSAHGRLVLGESTDDVRVTADVDGIRLRARYRPIPFPVKVSAGACRYQDTGFSVKNLAGALGSSSFTGLSGAVRWRRQPHLKMDSGRLSLKGRLDARAIAWLSRRLPLPPLIKLRPLTLSATRLKWNKDGETHVTASVSSDQGGGASLDMTYGPRGLAIKKLAVDDQDSRAVMGLALREKGFDLSFKGRLGRASLDRLLVKNDILSGWVKGAFKSHIDIDHPLESTAQGHLEGKEVNAIWGFALPVRAHRFSLSADGSHIDLASSEFSWRDTTMQMNGGVSFAAGRIAVDLRLDTDEIKGDELFKSLKQGGRNPRQGPAEIPLPSTVTGHLRVNTGRFVYGGLIWKPLRADLSLSAKGLDVDVTEANLCGIATPGAIHISPRNVIQVDFRPSAADRQLGQSLPCLYGDKVRFEGRYDLSGRIFGRAPAGELVKSLRGNLQYEAYKGRFYYDVLLLTVLDYLSAEKVITDHIDDVRRKGRAFRLIAVHARLEKEKVIVENMEIDSDDIKVAGQGTIGLADHSLDLNLLVAVVKTVNRVVAKVPLLGGIFDDMLSVPVKVKGDWENPHVRPLSPVAVGAELRGILEKIVTLGRKRRRP